jgi:hypothetical protein
MLRNTADCEADVLRFIQRVAESEVVWHLNSDNGTASCESNAEGTEEDPATVLLFFSDQAYARRCQKAHFPDHEVCSISLFNFLYRWLPGMSGDGVLAGPNWNQHLVGSELDPFELRERIEEVLTPELASKQLEEYQRLAAG